MSYRIAVLPGDGIGPEVTAEAQRTLAAVGQRFGHAFGFTKGLVGGASLEVSGSPLTADTIALCRDSDAVLFGAIGGPRWDEHPNFDLRPGQAILGLRKTLGLYVNLRPVKPLPMLSDRSPVRQLETEAGAVEKAVVAAREAVYRTADIASPGSTTVGTREMGQRVIDRIRSQED